MCFIIIIFHFVLFFSASSAQVQLAQYAFVFFSYKPVIIVESSFCLYKAKLKYYLKEYAIMHEATKRIRLGMETFVGIIREYHPEQSYFTFCSCYKLVPHKFYYMNSSLACLGLEVTKHNNTTTIASTHTFI